jgi:C4-dicarboxylate-specific signal transduction histidine kinase
MLFDAQGQPIGRIGVARDITRRIQDEEKRKEFEIKALAQDKLASLGEIATGVAHEVNQPLSYIKIILESTLNDLSNNQLDTTELNEEFQESLRQVSKITNIISHLRTFGRSDVASFDPVSLPGVFGDTMILMQERLRVKNISINKQIVDNLPMIYGNSVKLEQVFINLLQNSMDALEEKGKGEIDLVMEHADDNVIVRFSDNGSGMPPGVFEKIFEPFYTTKEVGQGTGIGLAIVYGIIQEHKGSITCASEEGQGTSFTIKLPVYKEKFPAFTSQFSNA